MKIQSKLLLSAMLAIGPAAAYPDAKVIIEPASEEGAVTELGLSTATAIKFSGNSVLVDNGGNVAEFPFASVGKIRFSTSPSSLGSIDSEATLSLRRNPVESVLSISGYSGSPAQVAILSANGQTFFRSESWQGEDIDVSALTPGLYIVTVNNENLKFIKR